MPTYGYRCKSCSYEFEEFQKVSDAPLVQCPSCKKETLMRIIGGGAGLHFKGSGFYPTDYKNKSTGGGEKESKGKSETKPDSKPETKSETKPTDSTPSKPSGESPSAN
ncbi:MAG: zinc ribbon domain-containing protein [Ignavibacteriales bacterium]|nr:zinc ribbon domain-containing protein [Ignavibacteriales bacterium]